MPSLWTLSTARSRIALVFVVCAVYGRSLAFGFTGVDDEDLIANDQPFLSKLSSVVLAFGRTYFHAIDRGHSYYRPVVTASYALDAQWSGVSPMGYHATNALLHAAACVLLHALLRRAQLTNPVALIGSLLFAVHPALTSAVAWIPGRNDVLLGVFALGAVLLFAKDADEPSWHSRAGHWACFALALFTKESAVVLPLACVLFALCTQRAAALKRATLWVAWGLALLLYGVARSRVVQGSAIDGDTLGRVVANAPAVLSSFGKWAFPLSLSPLANARDDSPWLGVLACAVLALGTFVVPHTRRRVAALGAGLFVLFVLPSLAVGGALTLESRLYVPAAFGMILVGELLRATSARSSEAPRMVAVFAAMGALALGALTLGHMGAFRNRLTFARAAVEGSPRSALARFALGHAYHREGRLDDALREYAAALALDPNEPIVRNDMAVVHMQRAEWAKAEEALRGELSREPCYVNAWVNLGKVLRRQGRDDEAELSFERARACER